MPLPLPTTPIDSTSARSRLDVIDQRERTLDAMLRRAALLPDHDRLLVELTFKNHVSLRQIALAFNKNPGTISRSVKRVLRQLNHPTALALLEHNCPLDPDLRQIGVERHLCGLTITQLLTKHQLNRHQLRLKLSSIDLWMKLRPTLRREFAST